MSHCFSDVQPLFCKSAPVTFFNNPTTLNSVTHLALKLTKCFLFTNNSESALCVWNHLNLTETFYPNFKDEGHKSLRAWIWREGLIFKALAALTGDPCSVPSANMLARVSYNSSWRSESLLWFLQTQDTHAVHMHAVITVMTPKIKF